MFIKLSIFSLLHRLGRRQQHKSTYVSYKDASCMGAVLGTSFSGDLDLSVDLVALDTSRLRKRKSTVTSNVARQNITSNVHQLHVTSDVRQLHVTSNAPRLRVTSIVRRVSDTSNVPRLTGTSYVRRLSATSNESQLSVYRQRTIKKSMRRIRKQLRHGDHLTTMAVL